MTTIEIGKLTTTNIQEKANLIWAIANHLVGLFKPHEYGKVILPMTVLKRFDDALKETKQEVLELNKKIESQKTIDAIKDGLLCKKTGYDFYNISPFTFENLLADPDNIAANFDTYLKGFSDNVKDIISNFKFEQTLETMHKGNVLYIVIQEFNSKKADMHPEKITSMDMGYIFEELIRKFSESYDEQAGAHFTSRDIIYLMTELLVANEKVHIKQNGVVKTAYDMAMGTSQMLGCLDEKMIEINPDSKLSLFGQEFNPETYAIAKADMLIKGGNAHNMKFGDTLNDDQFSNYEFDYIISNPPFGIDWKKEEKEVKKEYSKLGYEGRFGPGLPAISDGQMLFLLNGVKKLKEGSGRMAIIQNGSSLFTGDAGSGPSEIRKYLIESDLLEAIVQLPTDLFYNTGISTYVWIVSKGKSKERSGKIQLIDASNCYVKRRKNIGKKRVDLDDQAIDLIAKAYVEFKENKYEFSDLVVESKIFDNDFFGYSKVTVESPLLDENDKPILKKGKPQADSKKRDTELVPLQEDIESFFKENVLPYNPLAWMDRSKDKVGYEIPFTRLFYKFIPPKTSSDIFSEIKHLEEEGTQLMKELFGDEV
jgi:type I restriction enzyme M protein